MPPNRSQETPVIPDAAVRMSVNYDEIKAAPKNSRTADIYLSSLSEKENSTAASTAASPGSWTKSAWKSASSLFPFYGMNRKSFSASSNATQLLAVGIILPPFLFLLIVFLLCEVIL